MCTDQLDHRIRDRIVGRRFADGWFTCARLMGLVIEVLGMPHKIPKPTQACTRETGVEIQGTPKIKQVLDQNVDPSNIDQVPSNAHLSEKASQLCIFEDRPQEILFNCFPMFNSRMFAQFQASAALKRSKPDSSGCAGESRFSNC